MMLIANLHNSIYFLLLIILCQIGKKFVNAFRAHLHKNAVILHLFPITFLLEMADCSTT